MMLEDTERTSLHARTKCSYKSTRRKDTTDDAVHNGSLTVDRSDRRVRHNNKIRWQ